MKKLTIKFCNPTQFFLLTQTNKPMKTKLVFLIAALILATSFNVSADPHKKKRKKSKYKTTACTFGKKCRL